MKKLILGLLLVLSTAGVTCAQETLPCLDYNEAVSTLQECYYKPDEVKDIPAWLDVQTPEERDEALKKIFQGLNNRWTTYYSPSEVWNYETGYADLGISVTKSADGRWLVELISFHFPADKAGLRVGDEVVSVGGKSLKGLDKEGVRKLLRGKPGDKVPLVYRTGGGGTEKREVSTQIYASTAPDSVVAKLLPGNIAYFHIRDFVSDFMLETVALKAWEMHAECDGHLHGIVLDVRGNHGGYMWQSYSLLSAFIEKGCVGKWTNRKGAHEELAKPWVEKFLGKRPGAAAVARALYELPMMLLVDESTMSAAEATTAGLLDRARVTAIGEKTWGKGMHFNTTYLNDGGVMNVVGGKFTGPKGVDHHGVGIMPTTVVARSRGTGKDEQLHTALHLLAPDLYQPVEQPAPPLPVPPAEQSPVRPEVLVWLVFGAGGSLFLLIVVALVVRRSRRRRQRQAFSERYARFVDWTRPQPAQDCDDFLEFDVSLLEPLTPAPVQTDAWFNQFLLNDNQAAEPGSSFELSADHFYNGAPCCCCSHILQAGETVTEVVLGSGIQYSCQQCGSAKNCSANAVPCGAAAVEPRMTQE